MKNLIINDIINHLEFLGYIIDAKEENENDLLYCYHETRSNLVVRVINGLVLIISPYKIAVTQVSMELFELIREINNQTLVSKWYTMPHTKGEAVILHVEGYLYGYDKLTFAKILERMEHNVNTYLPRINDLQEKKKIPKSGG
ncbi:MAG TPA: hypothetical protein VN397_02910 [Candidatus Methylomirabilis sp.]|nr:hypothetical protein [Candidatus Methylomirabilis sp.]